MIRNATMLMMIGEYFLVILLVSLMIYRKYTLLYVALDKGVYQMPVM